WARAPWWSTVMKDFSLPSTASMRPRKCSVTSTGEMSLRAIRSRIRQAGIQVRSSPPAGEAASAWPAIPPVAAARAPPAMPFSRLRRVGCIGVSGWRSWSLMGGSWLFEVMGGRGRRAAPLGDCQPAPDGPGSELTLIYITDKIVPPWRPPGSRPVLPHSLTRQGRDGTLCAPAAVSARSRPADGIRTPSPRESPAARRRPGGAARPPAGHLLAAQPAHHRGHVRRFLRHPRRDERQFRARRHRHLRRHVLRRPRRPGGAADQHPERLRCPVRQPVGHGVLWRRPRRGGLQLDAGGSRQGGLGGGLHLCLLRGPAPRPLQHPGGCGGQALLHRPRQPLGGGPGGGHGVGGYGEAPTTALAVVAAIVTSLAGLLMVSNFRYKSL